MSPAATTRRVSGAAVVLFAAAGLVTVHCASGDDHPEGKSTTGSGSFSGTGGGTPFDVDPGPPVAACPSSQCAYPFADCNGDLSDGCEVDLSQDRDNCGLCQNSCPLQLGTCEGGVCTARCFNFGNCAGAELNADCDGDLGNQCEANLLTDVANCGGCGVACAPGEPCVEGTCGCTGGRVMCGDVCADLSSDPVNCNACGNVCPDANLGDDVVATCKNGQCGLGCNERCGLFDCDNDPATACVELGTPEHCSACNDACGPGLPCIEGKCCDPAKLDSDTQNCGACGNVCANELLDRFATKNPETQRIWFTVACEVGVCKASCVAPHLDCDGDIGAASSNGCETDVSHDPKNCGGCGVTCETDQVCLFGRCATEPCSGGVK